MKAYGGADVSIHIFLTSALAECRQLHAPADLPPGTKWIERWVGRRENS
jgi:hypothetical protein